MKLKDKKIEILAAVHTTDPEGFSTETLEPVAPPVWAYFRQLSGKEVFAAQSVQRHTSYGTAVFCTILPAWTCSRGIPRT